MTERKMTAWAMVWLALMVSMVCSTATAVFLLLTKIVLLLDGAERLWQYNNWRYIGIVVSIVCLYLYFRFEKGIRLKLGWDVYG